MNLLQLSVVLVLIYTQSVYTRSHKRVGNYNAVMAALQNMMGPKNCEKPLQISRMANQLPPVYEDVSPIMPYRAMPRMASQLPPVYEDVAPIMPYRAMPREISMPNMRPVESKCPCQMGATYPIRREFSLDNMVDMPIAPNVPAYTMALAQMPLYSQPTPDIMTVPVSYPVPSTVQKKPGCGCSCPAPAPIVSPFLPSASPVSPWAPPTSNLLPPVIPSEVRSHFLRKIPIPPPTL